MEGSALRVSGFMISSTIDVLPSPVNLKSWEINQDEMCGLCRKSSGSLEHIVSSCKTLLPTCTWRHNQVLCEFAEVVPEEGVDRGP